MVLKELIFNNVYYGEGLGIFKELPSSQFLTLEGCGDLERTDFKGLSSSYGRVEVTLKQHVLTISTMGGCGGLERTDFNSFYYGRVWWS